MNIHSFSLFTPNDSIANVDFDTLVYDTYDYLDKLIDFKLSDIYYAAFKKYAEGHNDERALGVAKLIKYGTANEMSIWMLKYGMSFEDIKKLEPYISEINEKHIVFKPSISEVPDEDKECIKRFL